MDFSERCSNLIYQPLKRTFGNNSWIGFIRNWTILLPWLKALAINGIQLVLNAVTSILNSLGLTDLVNAIIHFILNLPAVIGAWQL